MKKIVEGPNIYLRYLMDSDLDRTWEWLHRYDVYSKIGVLVPFTKEQQRQWFADLQGCKMKIVFAVCHKVDCAHIGNVSLDMINLYHRNARLSIFIADKALRGKGFGTEAIKLLTQYAFSIQNLHKIWCKTDIGNSEVHRFYEKLGFRQEGLLKDHEIKDGIFVDKVLYAMFNEADVDKQKK
jgi:[ribosomal protein S5]-alanine N-acetyltransferase